MTSNTTTTIKAVTDGNGTKARPAPRREGLAALRDKEARSLISLVLEAIGTTSNVAYEMHSALYDRAKEHPADQLHNQLCEALTCLETTDHYLRMLGSVLDERADTEHQDQDDGDLEDPGEPPF